MSRLSLRSSVALLAGIAVTVPGVAYAVPSTPSPTPEPSATVSTSTTRSATPKTEAEKTVQLKLRVTRQPLHAYEYVTVEVQKPADATVVITTSYGHRETLPPSDARVVSWLVPPPLDGWDSGHRYTVTATPDNGPAHSVTVMRPEGVSELGYSLTITRPVKPTDPIGIQLHKVEIGAPVSIVVTAYEQDGTFATIQTTATSSSPRWLIRSGDGVRVAPQFHGRWDPKLPYLVTVRVGGEDALGDWVEGFRVSESSKPSKPVKDPKPGDRTVHYRRGLAATGW